MKVISLKKLVINKPLLNYLRKEGQERQTEEEVKGGKGGKEKGGKSRKGKR